MNKKLLSFVRHCGDVNLSINGENKVGFSLDGNWVNNFTATLTGDQGCVFPNDGSETDASALQAACIILNKIELVPFQNDSTYEKHVTDAAKKWLSETLPALLLEEFRNKPEIYKIEAYFKEEGEKEPSIAVHVELRTNQYANAIFEQVQDITLLGKVVSSTVSDGGEVTYIYKDAEDNENTVTRDMSDKIHLIGIDSFGKTKRLYECNDGWLIAASEDFAPFIEESKIVKI